MHKLDLTPADHYRTKLNGCVRKMAESYSGLIRSTRIDVERPQIWREGFQTSLHATALVSAGEQLLGLVTELKLAAILQDFEVMNEEVNTLSKAMETRCETVENEIDDLKHDLSLSLNELEAHYYSSEWRHPPAAE